MVTLSVMPGRFSICRLAPGTPPWGVAGPFYSITRTDEELSIVCAESDVPAGVKAGGGWRALKAEGPFDFKTIGIVASLSTPLAVRGIGIFIISTFDTDYLLVKQEDLEAASEALTLAGHQLRAAGERSPR
ncbi:MAG TPA: ACT domain-containing protein [Candidatus Polarisedimenticolia bacterium]|jgi:hypothetical protein